jgi:sugar phosphate isomerase/epimerase
MPRIGLKIDYKFDEDPYYKKLYGERNILDFLYKLGIRALETPVGPEMDKEGLAEHIKLCTKVGFNLSFHPHSEAREANPTHFSLETGNRCRIFHEAIFRLTDHATRLQQFETVVNIHPAAGHIKFDRDELLEKSVEFFNWAIDWCRANTPQVTPVAELQIRPNREEDIRRLGDNYGELLHIARHTDVGICWDFGHAYMNTKRFGDPLYPPDELIPHITHVHCHDAKDEDHQPLEYGNVPWKHFLAILLGVGFDGSIILEITPQQFLSANGLNSLIGSVNSIIRIIEK